MAKSFMADALGMMRAKERSDGTGDLIFGSSSNWIGMAENIGLLGIDQPAEVKALVRQTLFAARPGASPLAGVLAGTADWLGGVQKTYLLSLGVRLFQFVFLVVGPVD